jgi:ribosomal protein S1
MSDSNLDRVFGDYLAPARKEDWERAKAALRPGDRISGVVVARYVFGVFIDIGVGFPALLEVIQFDPPPGRRPLDIEDYPAIGNSVTARVVAFNDRNRQIALTQRAPHPYLDGESEG